MNAEQKKARDDLVRLVARAAYEAWKRGEAPVTLDDKRAGTSCLPYGIRTLE